MASPAAFPRPSTSPTITAASASTPRSSPEPTSIPSASPPSSAAPSPPRTTCLPAAQPVAVLAYDFWRRRFNGNPAILNQAVLLNGYPITVVGIAAPGYHGLDVGERTDLLVPTMMKNQMTPTWQGLDNRRVLWLQLIGRLKPGVSPKQASASLEPYYHGVLIMEMQSIPFRSQESRARFASKPLIFEPASQGISDLRESFQDPLLILFAIVAILLLIACANVANLQLARAVARQREIAVRLAIGAGRWALVRQLVAESLLLSLAGGAIGVLLSWWIASALLAGAPDLPVSAAPDPRVLAFTFALSILTGLAFGLVPAWQATSPQLALTLKDQAGSVILQSQPRAPAQGPGRLPGRPLPAHADRQRPLHALPPQPQSRRPRLPP